MAAKTAKSTSGARRKARAASAERADKSLDQFRNALERSLTLSRERIEEVMDDAVKRGRMTRDDANELVTSLVDRGRKQTEDLISEIESTWKQLRDEVSSRAERAREAAEEMMERAGVRSAKKKGKAKAAKRKAAPKKKDPAKKAPKKAANPIKGYGSLSAAEARAALSGLSAAQLRTVRTAEKRGKARKTVLADIEKRLG
jgi:polyhydroxyalkanoate synthesis regulator phasin